MFATGFGWREPLIQFHQSLTPRRPLEAPTAGTSRGPASGDCSHASIAISNYFHTLENMKSKEAITALSALASEARLAVYRLLVKRGPEGYTPSELAARLDLPAPTLSFHLKGLMHAGLVSSRREARNLFYSPNFDRMNALVAFLTENCCSLAEQSCGTTCEPQSRPARPRKRA